MSILSKIKTEIPFGEISDNAKVSATKKLVNSLLKATKENATTALNDFKFDLNIIYPLITLKSIKMHTPI